MLTKLRIKIHVLGRLICISVMPTIFFGGLAVNRVYETYWNQTIYRVQTVDFNLLSHTLPTKLSYAFYFNDTEEVQKTLDSNFSLFGLAVTNADGTEIMFLSGGLESTSDSPLWKQNLLSNPSLLSEHPYDYLTIPPPLKAQSTYENPRSNLPTILRDKDFNNSSIRYIGRVYYIRGIPPSFNSELSRWLSNLFSDSSSLNQYSYVFLFVFLGFTSVWLLIEIIINKNEESKKILIARLESTRQDSLLLSRERDRLQQDIFRATREQDLLRELARKGQVVTEDLQISQQEVASLKKQIEEISTLYKITSKEVEELENKGIIVDWTPKLDQISNTETFNRGELQIKLWLESFNFIVHDKYKKKLIPADFRRIAKFMGSKFELIFDFYSQLKSCLGNFKSFKYRFNNRNNTVERTAILSFADHLHSVGCIERKYMQRENYIEIRKITRDGEKIGFLSGSWLEIYLTCKIQSFFGRLLNDKIRYYFLNNLNVYLPNSEEAELDLVLMIEYGSKLRIPVIFECKTGEFRLSLDKYSRIAQFLKLSNIQMIFIISDELNSHNHSELETRHGITIAHLSKIDEIIQKLLDKAIA